MGGVGSAIASPDKFQAKAHGLKYTADLAKDGGMEFSLAIPGFDSPRIALAKQMAVFGAVNSVRNPADGLKPWDPKLSRQ
jgi:hypothetical protein